MPGTFETLVGLAAAAMLAAVSFQVGLTFCRQSATAHEQLVAAHMKTREPLDEDDGILTKETTTLTTATSSQLAPLPIKKHDRPTRRVVVGNCVGNNPVHIPDPAGFATLTMQAAFPEAEIVVNELSKTCTPTSDTKYPHTDIIFIAGWGFSDAQKKAITDPAKEDILSSPPTKSTKGLLMYNNVKVVRHYPNRTFIIAIHNEAHGGRGHLFDLMLESKANVDLAHSLCTSLFWPLAARWLWQGRWHGRTVEDLVVKDDFNASAALAQKTRFCVFRHKQCDKGFYSRNAATRVALFDAISSQYKQVDGLGSCRGDPQIRKLYNKEPGPNERQKLHYTDSSIDTFEQYKFSFAMENNFVDGYWTEKMINGIFSNTVPIFAGYDTLEESSMSKYINLDRVVYCRFNRTFFEHSHDFPRFDAKDPEIRIKYLGKMQAKELKECVDQIRTVDENDELWKRKISTPFLKNNEVTESSIFSLKMVGEGIRQSLIDHESYLIK